MSHFRLVSDNAADLFATPPVAAPAPDLRDLDLEQGVIAALERLARGRALTDEWGRPVSRYDVQDHAGLRAAGLAGIQARLRPHLRRDHPWRDQAAELVDKLAVEEAHWWGVSGRRL